MKAQKKTVLPKLDKYSADIPIFRWNDEIVTEQQYNDLIEEHKQWVVALETPVVETIPAKRSKRK